ncbi:hypothetical protein HPB51_024073 [Rhipicephalus microplus]|uniref:Uncharacterized protein n=1 Tax=Rhipicephalus microplus TaxID=6941 RepID=A0A9J6EE56_RHIMP|nr:hypothetical protein HPB51_024073 [Rhipicephalus microplus]
MPMIKELQDKTKKIAERLDKRKNTPQPRHHGSRTQDVTNANRATFQKSLFAVGTPLNPPAMGRSPNRSPPRASRKAGAFAPITSPAIKTPTKLNGRPSRPIAPPRSPYRVPVYYPSPEDHRRRVAHNERSRGNDATRVVTRGLRDAAESDPSDESYRSIALRVGSGHTSPRRPAAWQSPLGLRDERYEHLGFNVAPPPQRGYQAAHWGRHAAPSGGQSLSRRVHDEELFVPPRGAHSSPGIRNRPGDAHMFRRFNSNVAWVTDEYSKHKQQGPAYYGSPNP